MGRWNTLVLLVVPPPPSLFPGFSLLSNEMLNICFLRAPFRCSPGLLVVRSIPYVMSSGFYYFQGLKIGPLTFPPRPVITENVWHASSFWELWPFPARLVFIVVFCCSSFLHHPESSSLLEVQAQQGRAVWMGAQRLIASVDAPASSVLYYLLPDTESSTQWSWLSSQFHS